MNFKLVGAFQITIILGRKSNAWEVPFSNTNIYVNICIVYSREHVIIKESDYCDTFRYIGLVLYRYMERLTRMATRTTQVI